MERFEVSDVDGEPTEPSARLEFRQRQLALAYRIFGALRWGHLGDGHISARDTTRPDHFWISRYGVPFQHVTIADLVLVNPGGDVIEGRGTINPAAHHIHWAVHEARPDAIAAAHTHTPYGTPFASMAKLLRPITQESCAFFEDHSLFDDQEVDILSIAAGRRIGVALAANKAVILRNHGLLTVGRSVAEAVGFFVAMERAAEAEMKAGSCAQPISADAARVAFGSVGTRDAGFHMFQWLVRSYVPDTTVVG